MANLRVFISHAHDEKDLAFAWQMLLEHTSQGAIEVWLSSDAKPSGGIQLGSEWRKNIYERLTATDQVLAVLSPRTLDRPWILWECGVASGTNNERGITPILFSMGTSESEFTGPLSSFQAYQGENRESVLQLLERLLNAADLKPKPDIWGPLLDTYFKTVQLHRPPRQAGPEIKELWLSRIEFLLNSGRTSELLHLAESMYSSLGTQEPVDSRIHDILSAAFLGGKHFEFALSEVERGLRKTPDDIDLLHRKALVFLEMGNRPAALETINQIYSIAPEARSFPEVAGVEGRLYRESFAATGSRDDLTRAIAAYATAYQHDRSSYYTGVNVAYLRFLDGDVEAAQKVANEVLETCLELQNRSDDSFWIDFTLGELSLILGDTDAALSHYRKGCSRPLRPDPRSRESALTRVKSLLVLQHRDSDIPVFESVLIL